MTTRRKLLIAAATCTALGAGFGAGWWAHSPRPAPEPAHESLVSFPGEELAVIERRLDTLDEHAVATRRVLAYLNHLVKQLAADGRTNYAPPDDDFEYPDQPPPDFILVEPTP